MGWPYQIELFSKQQELEWTAGFKKVMIEMIKASDRVPFTKKIQELNHKLNQLEKERNYKLNRK